MGTLGTATLAAHQIVFQTMLIIFMIPLGMSYAATVRVGQWFGQKNMRGIKQAGYLSIGAGASLAIAIAMIMLLFQKEIVSLYIDVNDPANAEIVRLAMPMLTIATVSQVLDAVQKITYGALQGLQDTRIPVLLNIPAFWITGLTSGYLLGFYFNLGGVGLWLGQSIGVAMAALLFLIRWQQKLAQIA